VETGIGCIDIDGLYDTTYSKELGDCTEDELRAIAAYDGYKSTELIIECEKLIYQSL